MELYSINSKNDGGCCDSNAIQRYNYQSRLNYVEKAVRSTEGIKQHEDALGNTIKLKPKNINMKDHHY